jgi:hypothetical protein
MVMRADALSLSMRASYRPASPDNSPEVEVFARALNPSCPGLSRPSTSFATGRRKTWMPGTRPGMTKKSYGANLE